MDSQAQPHGPAPKGRRGLGDRDAKRIALLVVAVVAAIWLVAFIVSNSKTVTVSFVFGNVSLSLIWVMIICAVLGAIIGSAIPRLTRRR